MAPTIVTIKDAKIGAGNPIALISGPCQLESHAHARMICEGLLAACAPSKTPLIFKASYDKANRSSLTATRGLGIDAGLQILADIRAEYGVPVLTDVHSPADCAPAAQAVDVLQIPAFLCRQTDLLLLAAGATGAAINVKKGQFLAPWDMRHVAEKLASTGNTRIMLCERGTSFGYNTLVTDFRGLPTMAETGWPVVFDATHSVQQPGAGRGQRRARQFAPVLARAACAVGVSALFIESHQDPDRAPSDGPNMIALSDMPKLIAQLVAFDRLAKEMQQ